MDIIPNIWSCLWLPLLASKSDIETMAIIYLLFQFKRSSKSYSNIRQHLWDSGTAQWGFHNVRIIAETRARVVVRILLDVIFLCLTVTKTWSRYISDLMFVFSSLNLITLINSWIVNKHGSVFWFLEITLLIIC